MSYDIGEQSVFYDLPFGEHERHKLDIFLPQSLNSIEKKLPFFVLIHGGGWTRGDKSRYHNFARFLNSKGYAAVCVSYRLLNMGSDCEGIMSDIHAGMNFIKENGGKYMLDTEKTALVGNSAGGHVALLYGYKMKEASPIKIAFIISEVGPTDFCDPSFFENCPDEVLHNRLWLVSALTGEPVSPGLVFSGNFPESVLRISPINYVDKDFPPTILEYGMEDPVVPYTNGERLFKKLRETDPDEARSQLILFRNSGHDLANDAEAKERSLELLDIFSARYLPLP